MGLAQDKPFILPNLDDVRRFPVCFIDDFSHQTLQDVFQSDQAAHFPVFVHDNGHMVLSGLELLQQGVQLHVVRDEIGSAHDVPDDDFACCRALELEKVLDVEDAHNGIPVAFKNRNAGVTGIDDPFHVEFFIDFNQKHVRTGGHDFGNTGVIEAEDVFDQFSFFVFDLAFFLHHLDHGPQLFFRGDGRLVDLAGQSGDEIQKLDDGQKEDREPVERKDNDPGDEHIVVGGHGLGNDFPEDQDEEGHDAGCNAHGIVGEIMHGHGRGQGGSPDIDQIVAHEDGGQQGMGVVFHLFDQTIKHAVAFGQVLGLDHTDGKQGCFRRGKKTGQGEQDHQYQDLA